jgi:hypothetical protein
VKKNAVIASPGTPLEKRKDIRKDKKAENQRQEPLQIPALFFPP